MPSGPARGSEREYDDLRRAWADLLHGLRPIDGWTITNELPDIDQLGQAFIDYFEISEPPFPVFEEMEQPDKDIAEYRYRLNRARRRASRARLLTLIAVLDSGLPVLLDGVKRDSNIVLEGELADSLRAAVGEIERLMADTAQRRGRWSELHRHLRFGQGRDWHDIHEFDWPSVKADVETGALAEVDPLPVPEIDLGDAAGGRLTGSVTIALPWSRLSDDDFERLLYDLLRDIETSRSIRTCSC